MTKTSPLNARAYPINKAKSLKQISKGVTVDVICNCVEQEYRKHQDWLFVAYQENEEVFKGWGDKKYIALEGG